jgi:hypothetical protein
MKKIVLFFTLSLLGAPVLRTQEGERVKFEIFHVDLVPATFLYGGAELAWSLAMYRALDKTIEAQQEVDSLFRKLVILEEKTQDYQKNLQSAFLQALNPSYTQFIVDEIHANQDWIDEYVIIYPQYQELAESIRKRVTDRADKIQRYINDAAKKTGNGGRLDNKQRNDLNIYVLDELLKLKYVSKNTKHQLWTVNPPQHDLRIPVLNE